MRTAYYGIKEIEGQIQIYKLSLYRKKVERKIERISNAERTSKSKIPIKEVIQPRFISYREAKIWFGRKVEEKEQKGYYGVMVEDSIEEENKLEKKIKEYLLTQLSKSNQKF